MNHRAKSPTLGIRPAFANSTALRHSTARDLAPKSASQSTAPVTIESVTVEVLGKIEILIAQARARIAVHDARTRASAKSEIVSDLMPLPSLTSAFATRRAIFGPVDLDEPVAGPGGLI